MNNLLLVAAVACLPGHRLLDFSSKVTGPNQSVNFVVTIEPLYARLNIYPLGLPNESVPCCGNKQTSVIRLLAGDGRFCLKQSQPQMTWRIGVIIAPEISL